MLRDIRIIKIYTMHSKFGRKLDASWTISGAFSLLSLEVPPYHKCLSAHTQKPVLIGLRKGYVL